MAQQILLAAWFVVGIVPFILQAQSYLKFMTPHKITENLVVPPGSESETTNMMALCPALGLQMAQVWRNIEKAHYRSMDDSVSRASIPRSWDLQRIQVGTIRLKHTNLRLIRHFRTTLVLTRVVKVSSFKVTRCRLQSLMPTRTLRTNYARRRKIYKDILKRMVMVATARTPMTAIATYGGYTMADYVGTPGFGFGNPFMQPQSWAQAAEQQRASMGTADAVPETPRTDRVETSLDHQALVVKQTDRLRYVIRPERVPAYHAAPSSCTNDSFLLFLFFYHGSIGFYSFYEEVRGTYWAGDRTVYGLIDRLGTLDLNGWLLPQDTESYDYRWSYWYNIVGMVWIVYRALVIRRSYTYTA
ncbi:hypothetical protein PHMEG_0003631 [Phytophthora megakarya]|uniref:Uncharacterized protein n=1 Tax=Phytophthora megakarya TaxID=4795 RepID=A0A225WVP5_9STRA|nr:hypothetical protein PHMEG_0003631 [Phytophthora megakarya]